MKIIIVSPAYPLRGGIADFTAQLYTELVKTSDVYVFTFKRQYPNVFFPGKTQLSIGEDDYKIPTKILIDSINPLTWIKTANEIIKINPDVVIFKYWMPFFAPCYSLIAKRIKKRIKTKLFSVCHNIMPHEKKFGDKFLNRLFLNKMDYFVLLSKEVEKDLLKLVKQPKSKVLFHPVYSKFGEKIDKEQARSNLNLKEEKYILFFGMVRKYKGLDILLEAINIVNQRMDVNLIVAGEFYEDENKYSEQINKLNLRNKVVFFKKFIPANEVKYYFSASDIVILPYREATQSGIIQIAINFDKPAIATNVGGLSEVIKEGKTGYIIEKENPQMLANAIEKFYLGNKLKEFEKNISSIKQEYSWKYFVDEIFNLIET